MNRERVDGWCERGILALVLGILVFGPLATGAVRTLEFLIIQGLTMGVIILWCARLWLNPRPQMLWPPICWIVVLFVGYAIARYLTADIEYVARQELIRVLIYAILFFAILNNLHRRESTQIVIFTLIFLAMAISFYAVFQFLTGSNRVWHFISPYKGRGSGTYISPNHLAGFLEMLLPLGLAYTLVGRAKPVTKVFLGYASLAVVAGIGVTVSRGSWVATGLALLIFFGLLVVHRNFRLTSLVLMIVLVSGGIFFVENTESFKDRFRKAFENGRLELDIRHEIWDATARMWQDHVWWGVGPGLFDCRFRPYRPSVLQMRPDLAHNDYLNTLADWGVVGASIVALALAALFVGVVKTWKHVRRPESHFGKSSGSNSFAFVLGASIGLLALLFHSALDFNMHIPANAILAISLMALLSAHLRFATESYWLTARLGVKLLATIALAAGFIYLGQQGWRRAHEYVWLQQASRAPLFSTAQAGALEKAFAAEPMNEETAYAIGEAYRTQSWEGGANYPELAARAMKWFSRCMTLNPYDGYGYLRYGMCLDWLDRHAEAGPYFNKADELDPNGSFTAANVGWHYVQIENYAAAKQWFERSLRLEGKDNTIAASYLGIVRQKMLEGTSDKPALPGGLHLP